MVDYSIEPETSLQTRPNAVLHCRNVLRRQELALLARGCGFDVTKDSRDSPETVSSPSIPDGISMLLIDFTSNSDPQEQELSTLAGYLKSSGAEALIWTDLDRLDVAYALFPATQCQFLVDASDAEAMLILARASRRGKMDQLHDNSRDNGFDDLHKMSDELAGFAKALAQMAGQDGQAEEIAGSGLADKPVSFRPAPSAAISPFIDEPKPQSGNLSATDIRSLIRNRRLRDQFFASDLFADPAWDILLDLMAARLEGKHVSVSSLCIAAAVPATTALRWITGMTESGLLERRMDPNDARRVFIELSQETVSQLEKYFAKLKSPELMI